MRWLNSKFLLVPGMVLLSCVAALAQGRTYENFGRTPTPEELKVMDMSIGPEGKELPEGSGTAKIGAPIFAAKCAVCHGPTAEESKLTYARLVGGQGSLTTDDPVITPGVSGRMQRRYGTLSAAPCRNIRLRRCQRTTYGPCIRSRA